MSSSNSSNAIVTLVAGLAIGGLLVGGLFLGGVFDEKPGVHVKDGGVEINLPEKIEIGKKK